MRPFTAAAASSAAAAASDVVFLDLNSKQHKRKVYVMH
jgi:hypothetical protein